MTEVDRTVSAWDPMGWSHAKVMWLGGATAGSLLFIPAAFVWLAWVTFYPLPYTGNMAPPDVLASIPVMGMMAVAAIIAPILWLIIVTINARTSASKVLWALGVLAGGGIVQAIAFFLFVWNPRSALAENSPGPIPQGA